MTPQEYNDRIKSRHSATVQITVEFDSTAADQARAIAGLLEKLGEAFNVKEFKDWYGWESTYPLALKIGTITSKDLPTQKLAVPEPVAVVEET